MKRLVLSLVAGAFGTLLVLPMAHAQSWQDMNEDAYAIRRDNAGIQHDREEQREALEHGNLGAAAREQAEIQQRRADRNARSEDLNNDWANRYYGDEGSYGRGWNRYNNDDDNE